MNVAREDDPWRARFFAALPEETRVTIEAASKADWLPVGMHVALADLVGEAFGPVRAHNYYRRAFAASLRGPVLGPLLRTGLRVLGVTPSSMVRWAGHGWTSSFRHCGAMSGGAARPRPRSPPLFRSTRRLHGVRRVARLGAGLGVRGAGCDGGQRRRASRQERPRARMHDARRGVARAGVGSPGVFPPRGAGRRLGPVRRWPWLRRSRGSTRSFRRC